MLSRTTPWQHPAPFAALLRCLRARPACLLAVALLAAHAALAAKEDPPTSRSTTLDPQAPPPSSAPKEPVAALPIPGGRREPIVFRGNLVFNDFVYRALLGLNLGAGPIALTPDADAARRVRGRLGSFLRSAGYELATVKVQVEDGRLAADVDEGQLDQIVVLGVGGWDSVRFHIDLDLPQDVYNRPLVDERLARLCPKYGLLRCTATLVEKVPPPTTALEQQTAETLEQVGGTLVPRELIRQARSHELRIKLEEPPQHTGLWPALDVGGADGVRLGLNGYLEGRPLEGGWSEIKLRAGFNLRSHLDGGGESVVFTRAIAEARSRLPAVSDGQLRGAYALLADVVSRQRSDLGLDTYYQARLEAALAADLTPRGRELELGAGFGVRRNFIFGERIVGTPDPVVASTPGDLFRPFLLFFLRSDLSPAELRYDRHHQLDLSLRLRTAGLGGGTSGTGSNSEFATELRWQRYFGLGWHEAWLRLHGQGRIGDTLFTDEDTLSSDLRGALGDTWLRSGATLLGEFRYSLVRDLLKVSAFTAGSVFGKIDDRITHAETARGAFAFGLGLHGLALTVVSIDFYGSFGWTSEGHFSPGLSLEIHEAYH
jgi:hypothetical protein